MKSILLVFDDYVCGWLTPYMSTAAPDFAWSLCNVCVVYLRVTLCSNSATVPLWFSDLSSKLSFLAVARYHFDFSKLLRLLGSGCYTKALAVPPQASANTWRH
jgi:hypothetical protein